MQIKGGSNGRTFGSITNKEIADELVKQGYEVNKKQIILSSPIKFAGRFTVEAKLFTGVNAKFTVVVETL
jgi:large subunit ribosomal protein L9